MSQHIQGLHGLYIGYQELIATLDDVVALLNANCETLVEVTILGHGRWKSRRPDMNPLHALKHITYIHIQPFNEDMRMLATWILDRVPNIQILFTVSRCLSDIVLFDAIIRLEHIQVLCLTANINHTKWLRELLLHHIQLVHRSKIEWLQLTFHGYYESMEHPFPWLYILGHLPRLRLLGISLPEMRNHAIYRDLAITIANDCPTIESLDLVYNSARLPEGALVPLQLHPNIKELVICNPKVTNCDLYGLTEFKTLKRLILRVQLEDRTIIQVLKKHIPRVEYLGHDGMPKSFFEE